MGLMSGMSPGYCSFRFSGVIRSITSFSWDRPPGYNIRLSIADQTMQQDPGVPENKEEEAKERIKGDYVDTNINEGNQAVRPLSNIPRKVGILSPSNLY